MKEIIDEYCWDKERKLFTHDHHNVPGIRNFAHYALHKAFPPVTEHFHSNIVEFHCLVKGRRVTRVGSRDYIITGRECFITFPFEEHSTGEFPENPCEFYAFQINTLPVDLFLGLSDDLRDYLIDMLLHLPHRHYRISYNDLQNLKASFDALALGDSPDNVYLSLQYLCCFLFNLKNLEPILEKRDPYTSPGIQKCIDYIEQHYKEPISLSALAKISGYSLSSFKVKFKDIIGITPAEYITLRKIEYAKHTLKSQNQSITDLAFELGFSSSNYFCTVFKKYTNLTPSRYSLQYRSEL
ncbi:MAG: AraC family transcriptional regulator [Clostridiales Family XIII bacterium]|nr:AraC family transcriptional regulator [Clostridiales Family XIII bacterium]